MGSYARSTSTAGVATAALNRIGGKRKRGNRRLKAAFEPPTRKPEVIAVDIPGYEPVCMGYKVEEK
jgi:hypothetical protein